jgi:hypothetical protein
VGSPPARPAAYLPALRYHLVFNFEAQAENIAPDAVRLVLKEVKEKAPDVAAAARA